MRFFNFRPRPLYSRERNEVLGGCVGHRARLDISEDREILPLPGFEPRTAQPVAYSRLFSCAPYRRQTSSCRLALPAHGWPFSGRNVLTRTSPEVPALRTANDAKTPDNYFTPTTVRGSIAGRGTRRFFSPKIQTASATLPDSCLMCTGDSFLGA